MLIKPRSMLLAASLMAVPLATAIAQQNNPTGNLGSNSSATAAPGTADSSAASGMTTGDSGAGKTTSTYGGMAMRSTAPGATGRTVVPGTTSSQASSAKSTEEQKTGGTAGGR